MSNPLPTRIGPNWLYEKDTGAVSGIKLEDGTTQALLNQAQAAAAQALVSGAWNPPQRFVGDDLSQPVSITARVKDWGKLACRFGSGMWYAATGAPTLTQGYTGWDGAGAKTGPVSRTSQMDMLKVVPAANSTEQISLATFATNMLTPALNGKFGLWVYVENMTGSGSLSVETGTAGVSTNSLNVAFTTNQVRNGWNFLAFVMRNPAAYVDGNPDIEAHPFGVVATNFGTGASSNILANPVTYMNIYWSNMLGATLYFDSMWTAFTSTPQVVLGCDGGINTESIALPVLQSYGWVAYHAYPIRVGSQITITDPIATAGAANGLQQRLYAAGWDVINHTANHVAVGGLTSEAAILYELETAKAWQLALDCVRGAEFYASPQSSSSPLAEKVIKGAGYKIQRHGRKQNTHLTPWGIDNPATVGGVDVSSNTASGYSQIQGGTASSVSGIQKASKAKILLDICEAYGCTLFPFWHGITTAGDTGTGEDLTGDDLLWTASAFRAFCAELRLREQAGRIEVSKGLTGWYYGVNA